MSLTMDQITDESNLFGLHIGDSGSGKSSAAACYPKPIYWLDIDKRIRGARRFLNDMGLLEKYGKQIKVDQFDLSKGFAGIDEKLEELLKERRPSFATVVFDGLSSTSDLLIDDAQNVISQMTGAQIAQARLSGSKRIGKMDLPGWDEFGYEQKGFKDIMLALKSLRCNVIVTAHWIDRYDDKGKVVGKTINLRNRIQSPIMKWFDEVYYFEKKFEKVGIGGQMTERTIHNVYFENDLARTTFPNLPKKADWTMQDFFEILKKGGVKYVESEGQANAK